MLFFCCYRLLHKQTKSRTGLLNGDLTFFPLTLWFYNRNSLVKMIVFGPLRLQAEQRNPKRRKKIKNVFYLAAGSIEVTWLLVQRVEASIHIYISFLAAKSFKFPFDLQVWTFYDVLFFAWFFPIFFQCDLMFCNPFYARKLKCIASSWKRGRDITPILLGIHNLAYFKQLHSAHVAEKKNVQRTSSWHHHIYAVIFSFLVSFRVISLATIASSGE